MSSLCSLPCEVAAALGEARVVVLCGVSGSGKTRLAVSLEEAGFARVSADELLWREYGDVFPSLPPESKRQVFMSLGAKVEQDVEAALEAGRRVVVDSTMCRRAKRDSMRELCARHGVEPLLVFLDVAEEELLRRLACRTGTGPDDQMVSPWQLHSYRLGFERPAPDEPHLTLR